MSDFFQKSKIPPARTKEQIFTEMHRGMRAWNAQIPESAERLDPVLRILMQLYSHQLAHIDQRVEHVWAAAANSLIRSLCPECLRYPIPSFTVMQCDPVDPVVEVDFHTRFFYKERREGGQTFYFSPLRREKLISAHVRRVLLAVDDSLVDLSPAPPGAAHGSARPRQMLGSGNTYRFYLGLEHRGLPGNFAGATIFLKGIPDVLKQLRWAWWYPGTAHGEFRSDSGFCPGLSGGLNEMFYGSGHSSDWGGLRTSADLFAPLDNSFVIFPDQFISRWEAGMPDKSLLEMAAQKGISLDASALPLYWIRLDLAGGGDKTKLEAPFEAHFNCFVAVNKNELTLFKHTGGNRLVEVELPEDIGSILEITRVVDSTGREYVGRHQGAITPGQRYFTPEERDNLLVLWFDFSSELDLPPDSITINYAVTTGVDANGIEAGRITELYENHPGISAARNITPVAGAIPPKTEAQIITEVSTRLRNRDRTLTFQEIARWTTTFDPRIKKAVCENGIERGDQGVRRCLIVRVQVKSEDFYSDDETQLLQTRLTEFLLSRAPVNTRFRVEIGKT